MIGQQVSFSLDLPLLFGPIAIRKKKRAQPTSYHTPQIKLHIKDTISTKSAGQNFDSPSCDPGCLNLSTLKSGGRLSGALTTKRRLPLFSPCSTLPTLHQRGSPRRSRPALRKGDLLRTANPLHPQKDWSSIDLPLSRGCSGINAWRFRDDGVLSCNSPPNKAPPFANKKKQKKS